MPHKLLALELFLTRFPEWRGKVTLIQVGVPSRTEVPEYQRLAERVNELVGRINGTFGNLEYAPVHYINQSITQEELVAIYNVADVCLVTSLRDGMNLVSYEFVAAQMDLPGVNQKEGPGVLVLSEFAGSVTWSHNFHSSEISLMATVRKSFEQALILKNQKIANNKIPQ